MSHYKKRQGKWLQQFDANYRRSIFSHSVEKINKYNYNWSWRMHNMMEFSRKRNKKSRKRATLSPNKRTTLASSKMRTKVAASVRAPPRSQIGSAASPCECDRLPRCRGAAIAANTRAGGRRSRSRMRKRRGIKSFRLIDSRSYNRLNYQ